MQLNCLFLFIDGSTMQIYPAGIGRVSVDESPLVAEYVQLIVRPTTAASSNAHRLIPYNPASQSAIGWIRYSICAGHTIEMSCGVDDRPECESGLPETLVPEAEIKAATTITKQLRIFILAHFTTEQLIFVTEKL